MTAEDEPLRLVGVQYAPGEEQRNSSRKNEEAEPKWKQCPVVDVTGCQHKDMNKQEMAWVNLDILEISELR